MKVNLEIEFSYRKPERINEIFYEYRQGSQWKVIMAGDGSLDSHRKAARGLFKMLRDDGNKVMQEIRVCRMDGEKKKVYFIMRGKDNEVISIGDNVGIICR